MNKTNRLFIDTRSGPYPGAVRLNCIGSPEREFGYYAEAFHEAGQTLVRDLRDVWKSGGNFSPVGSMKLPDTQERRRSGAPAELSLQPFPVL